MQRVAFTALLLGFLIQGRFRLASMLHLLGLASMLWHGMFREPVLRAAEPRVIASMAEKARAQGRRQLQRGEETTWETGQGFLRPEVPMGGNDTHTCCGVP